MKEYPKCHCVRLVHLSDYERFLNGEISIEEYSKLNSKNLVWSEPLEKNIVNELVHPLTSYERFISGEITAEEFSKLVEEYYSEKPKSHKFFSKLISVLYLLICLQSCSANLEIK
jgi:heme oxygenase